MTQTTAEIAPIPHLGFLWSVAHQREVAWVRAHALNHVGRDVEVYGKIGYFEDTIVSSAIVCPCGATLAEGESGPLRWNGTDGIHWVPMTRSQCQAWTSYHASH